MGLKFRQSIHPQTVEKITVFTFAILGLIGILNHVMWRDEFMSWLVARDSASISELYTNSIPGGHPFLWYLLLLMVKFIANTPIMMQILHWSLACIAIALFWRYSPFTTLQKVFFTFGYYTFYEYFLISRMYILAVLFSFLFCSFYPLRRKTYLPLALCLGLMANSHAYAFFIALPLGFILVVEWIWKPQQRKSYCRGLWQWDLIFSCIVAIAFLSFSIYTLIQAGESMSVGLDLFKFYLRHGFRVLGRILGGYTLLIPNSKRWLDLLICGVLSLGLITSVVIFLRRSPLALLFYSTSTIALMSFNYFVHLGQGSRHYGYYYIMLLISLWLCLSSQNSSLQQTKNSISQTKKRSRFRLIPFYPFIFTVILIIQLGAGLAFFALDSVVPLSAGKETAQYIQEQGWQDVFIVGSNDSRMTPIAGYLNRKLYYPEIQGIGSFSQWHKRVDVDHKEVLKQVSQLLNSSNDNLPPFDRILLILNNPLKQSHEEQIDQSELFSSPDLIIEPITKFEKAQHSGERYYLYWVTKQLTIDNGN